MRNHSRARTYDYKDVNLHVHFLTFAYLYLLTNVVTFLLCYYLFRQACHVKRAEERMVSCITYESSSEIRHKFCVRCTHIQTYIMDMHHFCLFQENTVKTFFISKIHFYMHSQRSTYVDISTNQNNYV